MIRLYYILFGLLCLPLTVFASDHFDCLGSEPYWHLSLTTDKFIFKQNAIPPLTMPVVKPQRAENMDIDHIRIYRTKANGSDVMIIIQKQSCTDGISEEVFSYEGLFISKEKVFHGCCSKKIVITHL